MTPKRVGSVYVYDQPNKSVEDYDVPTSRYFIPGTKVPTVVPEGLTTYDTPVPSTGRTFDAPQFSSAHVDGGDTYDVPRSLQGFENPPWSNRSSALSDASGGSSAVSSSLSYHSLHVGSTPSSSERSSADLSAQDIYDIPPSAKPAVLKCGNHLGKHLKSNSSFEKPDIPRKTDAFKALRKRSGTPDFLSQSTDIYDIPQSKQCINDTAPDYDVPKGDSDEKDELDIEIIYDSAHNVTKQCSPETKPPVDLPKKQQNRTSRGSKTGEKSLYDIPPQVVRDDVLSDRSEAFSDLVNRFSHCSEDTESINVPYEELPLELDTALELLVKLQQYVQRSTSKLLGYVSATWRQKDSLESKLYDIKIACVAVKRCLQDFVEFSQGALANSARVADRKLIQKIMKQLDPLQMSLQAINKSMTNLDAANWQLSKLVVEGNSSNVSDDLNEIITISKDIPNTSLLMTSLIQGNSSLLFKCPSQSTCDTMGKPPSSGPASTTKTKPKRPPPPVKPKPRMSTGSRGNSVESDDGVQKRPLPSPPTLSAHKSASAPVLPSPPAVTESVYAVPRSLKDDLAALDIEDDDYENDTREWLEEYDYVQLTSAAMAQQKKQEEHNARIINASNKEKQLLNQQKNAQNQYSPSPGQDKGGASQQQTSQPLQPQPQGSPFHSKVQQLANQTQAPSPNQPLYQTPLAKNRFQSPQPANSPQHTPYVSQGSSPQCQIQNERTQCQPPQMVPQSQLSQSGSAYTNTVSSVLNEMQSSPEKCPQPPGLSTPFKERLERLKQEVQKPVQTLQIPMSPTSQVAPPGMATLDENERQIVMFYASQIDDHLKLLVNAIGAFFQCIEYNQPPKVFISYSKFVVLAAHKLVYIGDSIARNIYTDDVTVKITACANLLCDCLKDTVTATKVAALHYPSVIRVQEMVDRVVDVSHAGNELRLAITQAAML